MKKTFVLIFSFFLFSSISLAQLNINAKLGSGISRFYEINLSQSTDRRTTSMPTIGNKAGLGIDYSYNNNKKISFDIFLEQKYDKTKFFVTDSAQYITEDTAYWCYDDIIYQTNLYSISVPIIFHRKINDKFSMGFGFANNFVLMNTERRQRFSAHIHLYQIKLNLLFNYQILNKTSLFLDVQNSITPYNTQISLFNSYLTANFFMSIGISQRLFSFQ